MSITDRYATIKSNLSLSESLVYSYLVVNATTVHCEIQVVAVVAPIVCAKPIVYRHGSVINDWPRYVTVSCYTFNSRTTKYITAVNIII